MNGEAEKIVRGALHAGGWKQKLSVVSGDRNGEASDRKSTPPRTGLAGSAHDRAPKHPLVQQARELFQAEVRSVLDLSQKT